MRDEQWSAGALVEASRGGVFKIAKRMPGGLLPSAQFHDWHARDVAGGRGAAPSLLRAELHGVRSTMEAQSKSGQMLGLTEGRA